MYKIVNNLLYVPSHCLPSLNLSATRAHHDPAEISSHTTMIFKKCLLLFIPTKNNSPMEYHADISNTDLETLPLCNVTIISLVN